MTLSTWGSNEGEGAQTLGNQTTAYHGLPAQARHLLCHPAITAALGRATVFPEPAGSTASFSTSARDAPWAAGMRGAPGTPAEIQSHAHPSEFCWTLWCWLLWGSNAHEVQTYTICVHSHGSGRPARYL